jgi:hypothetical protein
VASFDRNISFQNERLFRTEQRGKYCRPGYYFLQKDEHMKANKKMIKRNSRSHEMGNHIILSLIMTKIQMTKGQIAHDQASSHTP